MQLSPYALICDDHPLVGRGLQELLKSHPMIRSSVATHTAADCVEHARLHERPAIAILDFWLSENACESLIRDLRSLMADLPILVMSADDDPVVQLKCIEWGANGFINKQANPGVIREAVLALLQGLSWFTAPDKTQQRSPSIRHNQWPVTARELGLTVRQGQILAMMLQGHPNKRIAQALSLTEATIKEHVTGILHKLGVKSRVEAIAKLQNRKFESW